MGDKQTCIFIRSEKDNGKLQRDKEYMWGLWMGRKGDVAEGGKIHSIIDEKEQGIYERFIEVE